MLPGLGHMLTYEAPDVVADAIGDVAQRRLRMPLA